MPQGYYLLVGFAAWWIGGLIAFAGMRRALIKDLWDATAASCPWCFASEASQPRRFEKFRLLFGGILAVCRVPRRAYWSSWTPSNCPSPLGILQRQRARQLNLAAIYRRAQHSFSLPSQFLERILSWGRWGWRGRGFPFCRIFYHKVIRRCFRIIFGLCARSRWWAAGLHGARKGRIDLDNKWNEFGLLLCGHWFMIEMRLMMS